MKKELIFKNALKDIFAGADIEGTSGYVNLLNIKKRYFDDVFPELNKEIELDTRIDTDFKEEFYDKLYNFFHRYFSESGSIYFRHTPSYQKVYEQVYSEGKDVALFWKTHMLYYVKSDVIFQSAPVEVTNEDHNTFSFFIDASSIENKKSNERKDLTFTYDKISNKDGKKTIIINAQYSERGNRTKLEDIYKTIKSDGISNITEEVIEKAFRVFNKQSEVDFFINKDARGFLKEQFDLWMYQYMFKEENNFSQLRIKQMQAIKDWAYKIIDFIGQFEDELVKVWNKPKFVRGTNYVITIDKIGGGLIKKIEKHSGIKNQIAEWSELGIVEADFDFKKRDNEKHKHLPIDTKYFKDLELEIIGEQGNLDESLDGLLIHSENYQALNTIVEKYKGQVKCIYIDPPFNLDSSDQFMYRTNYKDSNWASLLENRLRLAHELLSEDGSIFVRCDYNGNFIVRELLNQIFNEENYRNEIILSKSAKLTESINRYHSAHDSLYWYSKTLNYDFKTATKKRDNPKWRPMHLPGIRWSPIESDFLDMFSDLNISIRKGKPTSKARIIFGKEMLPPEGRHWAISQRDILKFEKEGKIRLKDNGEPESQEDDDQKLTDNWTDHVGYSSFWGFTTENHEKVLERVIKTANVKSDEIVLDFFGGLGSTMATACKLGVKFISIEMGNHFDTFYLDGTVNKCGEVGRIKQVVNGYGNVEPSGISGEIQYKNRSSIIKYYSLEQYEETLARAKYSKENNLTIWDGNKSIFAQYIFNTDQKLTDFIKISDRDLNVNLVDIYPDIDIAETLSNITGKHIAKKNIDTVEFMDGTIEKINPEQMTFDEKMHFISLIKPLIWWGE